MCKHNQFCLPPIICFERQNNKLQCCVGCIYYTSDNVKIEDGNGDYICRWCCCLPCTACETAEMILSPIYCQCKCDTIHIHKGTSANQQINDYIKKHKIRTQTNKYLYHTFGRILLEEGPVIQKMTNTQIEDIINNVNQANIEGYSVVRQ